MSRKITFAEAIREGIENKMEKEKDIVYFGIDARQSPWGFTEGLVEKFGSERIVNTPIAESAIVGTGIGAAIMGLRAFAEIMFEDFAMLAMDHIYNNMGSWHYLTNGQYKVPLTVITSTGGGTRGGYGHSQALYPVFMSAPGISICVPSTPYDAKGLIKTAVMSDNPVIYSVDRILLRDDFKEHVPEEEYTIPFGRAKIVKEGKDVTIVALAKMVGEAQKSVEGLEKDGISMEIIDLRTLAPLDKDSILKSVAKTGRLVVAEESRVVNGVGSEVLSIIASEDPSLLKAPAKKVAAPMIPVPAGDILEDLYLPSHKSISEVVRELFN